jgi:hypothetical protein
MEKLQKPTSSERYTPPSQFKFFKFLINFNFFINLINKNVILSKFLILYIFLLCACTEKSSVTQELILNSLATCSNSSNDLGSPLFDRKFL